MDVEGRHSKVIIHLLVGPYRLYNIILLSSSTCAFNVAKKDL